MSSATFSGFLLVMFLSGCAVVKTPYFQSDYYEKTITGLDSLAPDIKVTTDSLYAGFSKRNIIPDPRNISKTNKNKGLPIAGYGQLKTKYATGINDSVFVRAVALKAGSVTNIIVSAELLIMPPNIIDSVIIRLREKGIKREQLFFSATHTHSSIGGWGYGFLAKLMAGKRNPDIEKWLEDQITIAVLDAVNDLKPAQFVQDNFDAPRYTRNRLTGNPEHNNTSFDYFVLEQIPGKRSVIGIYSAHSTTSSGKNRLISGDYPGYWSRKIESSGFASMAIFCGGSMGGQSPAGKGNEFESARFIGESLADSVLMRTGNLRFQNWLPITSVSLKTELPEYHFRISANRNLSANLSERLMPAPANVYVQALRLNKTVWFFTPGDFSGESALLIRKILRGKGYESIISGYNGSYIGYIVPGKYFYLKHYETRAMSWFGPTLGDYMTDIMEKMHLILAD